MLKEIELKVVRTMGARFCPSAVFLQYHTRRYCTINCTKIKNQFTAIISVNNIYYNKLDCSIVQYALQRTHTYTALICNIYDVCYFDVITKMGISVITENIAISPSISDFSTQNLIPSYSARSYLQAYIFFIYV